MGTIRTGARLFKAAVDQALDVKQKITNTVNKLRARGKQIACKVKKAIKSFFANFKRKKPKKSGLILIHNVAKVGNKKDSKRREI